MNRTPINGFKVRHFTIKQRLKWSARRDSNTHFDALEASDSAVGLLAVGRGQWIRTTTVLLLRQLSPAVGLRPRSTYGT